MLCRRQAKVLHFLIGVSLGIKAFSKKSIVGIYTILLSQQSAILRYLHVTGHEIVAVEVLRQIQCIQDWSAAPQSHGNL